LTNMYAAGKNQAIMRRFGLNSKMNRTSGYAHWLDKFQPVNVVMV